MRLSRGEADEIGSALAEDVGKVQEFSGIAGKASKLAEDQRFDTTRPNVSEHPLGFGVFHHALAGHAREVVQLDDLPVRLDSAVRWLRISQFQRA